MVDLNLRTSSTYIFPEEVTNGASTETARAGRKRVEPPFNERHLQLDSLPVSGACILQTTPCPHPPKKPDTEQFASKDPVSSSWQGAGNRRVHHMFPLIDRRYGG